MRAAMPSEISKGRALCAAGWSRLRSSAMFYGALATAVRVGANLLLLPLMLGLPPGELALWYVLLALGEMANLADFGFGPAVTRVYSYFWAGAEDFDVRGLRAPPRHGNPNLEALGRFHATVGHLYRWVSLIGAGVLAVGGTCYLLGDLQGAARPLQLWGVWITFVLVVGYNLRTSYWALACQGVNRVREVQSSGLYGGLVYLGTAVALLSCGLGLTALVVAMACRAVVSRAICRWGYLRAGPGLGLARPVDEAMLRKLWPNAREFGIMTVGAYLINYGGILVAKPFLTAAETASYGVTLQIGRFMVGLATLWLSTQWPRLTILRVQGRQREMAVLFARRLGLTLGSLALMSLVLALLGNRVLEWKGTLNRLLPTPALLLYCGYLMFQNFYGMFGQLTFTENHNPFYRIAIATGLGMFGLSLVLTPQVGLWGLLTAPVLAEAAYSAWFTTRRGFQGQPLSVREFVRAALCGTA